MNLKKEKLILRKHELKKKKKLLLGKVLICRDTKSTQKYNTQD